MHTHQQTTGGARYAVLCGIAILLLAICAWAARAAASETRAGVMLDDFGGDAESRWQRGGNAQGWTVSAEPVDAREGRQALSINYNLSGHHLALLRIFSPPFDFGQDDALQLWAWSDHPHPDLQLVVDAGTTDGHIMRGAYLRHSRPVDWEGWRILTFTRRSFWLTDPKASWPESIGAFRIILEVKDGAREAGVFRVAALQRLPQILSESELDDRAIQNWRPLPARRWFGVTLNPQAFGCTDLPEPKRLAEQCRLLKSIGVDTLRMDLSWASLEPKEGQWRFEPWRERLRVIVGSGLLLKPIISFHVVPDWFWEKHPDALMRDEHRCMTREWISYWHPQLRSHQELFTRQCIAGLLREFDPAIVAIHVAVGMYGEPLYPGLPHPAFWCYDANAQADFRRRMRERYSDIAKANAGWGVDFPDWDSVRIPLPGTRTGPFWRDVLEWYRKSRDDHVLWTLKMTSGYIRKPLVVYDGMGLLSRSHRMLAIVGGGGDWPDVWRVKTMGDFSGFFPFMVRQGFWTEPAGLPQLHGVTSTIAACIRERWKITIWGENVGDPEGRDPLDTAKLVRKYRFDGMEFISLEPLFDQSGRPTHLFDRLREAVEVVKGKPG